MYNIGDIIKDTAGFGDVKIVDIFKSVTTPETQIYKIEVMDDSHMITFAGIDELQPMFPTDR